MGQTLTLKLDANTSAQLDTLSQALGFSREMTAVYAVRLVSACMREGLLDNFPARAWPREASLFIPSSNVITFPGTKTADAEFRA